MQSQSRSGSLPPSGAGSVGSGGSPVVGGAAGPTPPPNFKSCIQLAACATNQILPMNPELPADLFTACLTTPIRVIHLNEFDYEVVTGLSPSATRSRCDGSFSKTRRDWSRG
jgi:hypothetical protein